MIDSSNWTTSALSGLSDKFSSCKLCADVKLSTWISDMLLEFKLIVHRAGSCCRNSGKCRIMLWDTLIYSNFFKWENSSGRLLKLL